MTPAQLLAAVAVATGVLAAPALHQAAQAPAPPPVRQSSAPARAPMPFGVGERLNYDVRFGPMKVGSGSMHVLGIVDVRGKDTYHTQFRVKGGTFFYKVNDVFESWFDTTTLASQRFLQDFEEGGRNREKKYEIYPERRVYQEEGRPETPTVGQPLDDGSFLYFIRTIPLEVGQTYVFDRYFKPDRNPVKIRVLRRERVTVPAGTFNAIVVSPAIKTKGIFSENGRAEVWLSDDDRRIMLQMKSQLSFGSLNLYLKSYTPAPGTTSRAATGGP